MDGGWWSSSSSLFSPLRFFCWCCCLLPARFPIFVCPTPTSLPLECCCCCCCCVARRCTPTVLSERARIRISNSVELCASSPPLAKLVARSFGSFALSLFLVSTRLHTPRSLQTPTLPPPTLSPLCLRVVRSVLVALSPPTFLCPLAGFSAASKREYPSPPPHPPVQCVCGRVSR